jgi:hypothetical protein
MRSSRLFKYALLACVIMPACSAWSQDIGTDELLADLLYIF